MTKEGHHLDNRSIEDLKNDFRNAGLSDDLADSIFGKTPHGNNPRPPYIEYEVTIDKTQAIKGINKDLVCDNHKLRVVIPAKVKNGTRLRLRNARQVTDGIPGDIYVKVNIVKSSKHPASDLIGFHLWDRVEQLFKKGK